MARTGTQRKVRSAPATAAVASNPPSSMEPSSRARSTASGRRATPTTRRASPRCFQTMPSEPPSRPMPMMQIDEYAIVCRKESLATRRPARSDRPRELPEEQLLSIGRVFRRIDARGTRLRPRPGESGG